MRKINVVVHEESGAVLAVATAQDARPRDELVGDTLPLVIDFEHEIAIGRSLLAAYAVEADETIFADPLNHFVTVAQEPGQPNRTVDLTPVVDTITVDTAAVKISVAPDAVTKRRSWLLVQKPGNAAFEVGPKLIGNSATEVTFSTVLDAGDMVVFIVEKHRPVITVV